MGQSVSGTIAVEDAAARVEVQLPMLLGMFSAKVRQVIAEKGGRAAGGLNGPPADLYGILIKRPGRPHSFSAASDRKTPREYRGWCDAG